ncbi:MAG: DUF4276 family protein [Chloroflexi bacterium]|nr:DUF4276 family protein [Chloroflexota bacterium]
MTRLLVHVEGQTEESFVGQLLRPHLIGGFGYTDVSARLLGNSRQRSRRGGARSWTAVRQDIVRHLRQDPNARSTTMVDFYGMPQTGDRAWPGRAEANAVPFDQKAAVVQVAIADDIAAEVDGSKGRFLPYVVMHEYEGLLFSDPERFAEAIGSRDSAGEFRAIRSAFHTPEEINDSPLTAPSKRVESLFPGYQKPLMGTIAAQRIGLGPIRAECPYFDKWVESLELWGL